VSHYLGHLGDWSSIVDQALTAAGGASGRLSQEVLKQAARYATDQPMVTVNRARSAALVDYGYHQFDRWERWQPFVFGASGTIAIVSVAMLYRRWRVPEAALVYAVSAGLNSGIAWLTRPSALRPAPAPAPPMPPGEAPPPQPLQQVLGWLDRRVGRLNASDPGWETQTWERLAHDLGFGTMDPYARTLLTRHAQ